MMPGGDCNIKKEIAMSPFNHLHGWEETRGGSFTHGQYRNAQRKPTSGMVLDDIPKVGPRKVRAIRMQIAQCIKLLVECFQSIHKTCVNDGSLQCHQLKMLEVVEVRR
jgi:hypothetical protein